MKFSGTPYLMMLGAYLNLYDIRITLLSKSGTTVIKANIWQPVLVLLRKFISFFQIILLHFFGLVPRVTMLFKNMTTIKQYRARTWKYLKYWTWTLWIILTHKIQIKFDIPADIYVLSNSRTRCEICSKLTIKTAERYIYSNWNNRRFSGQNK